MKVLMKWWWGHPIPHLSDEDIKHRLTILRIRKCFEFFGHDVSQLSDQELIERSTLAARKLSNLGMTGEDCLVHARRMSDLSHRAGIEPIPPEVL